MSKSSESSPHILREVEPSYTLRTFYNLTSNIQKIYGTERAVHEQWTAAETARELDSRIDRILEKHRWMLAREEGAKS